MPGRTARHGARCRNPVMHRRPRSVRAHPRGGVGSFRLAICPSPSYLYPASTLLGRKLPRQSEVWGCAALARIPRRGRGGGGSGCEGNQLASHPDSASQPPPRLPPAPPNAPRKAFCVPTPRPCAQLALPGAGHLGQPILSVFLVMGIAQECLPRL